MSLHPTARALLEAIAAKASETKNTARYVSMWRPKNDKQDDAVDVAFGAWLDAGCPIDSAPPDDLAAAEAWARGLGFERSPYSRGRWRGETDAHVLVDEGNDRRWWYWLPHGAAISGFPTSDAALIAAWKARPEANPLPRADGTGRWVPETEDRLATLEARLTAIDAFDADFVDDTGNRFGAITARLNEVCDRLGIAPVEEP